MRVADQAAQKSDRWLFVSLLLVLLLAGLWVWRWMIADREKLAGRLTAITDRHIESSEKLGEVIANNTAALREVRQVIEFCRRNGK